MSCAPVPLSRRLAIVLAMFVALAAFGTFTPTPAPAQEGAKAAEEKKEGEAPEQKNYIWWIIESSGSIGLVLLLLSMYFIATVGRLFVELRPQVVTPPEVTEECDALLEKRDFKGIYAVVREDDSAYSRIVSAGLAELSNGLADAREAMQHVGEVIVVEMEKKISMLAVLGTLGPMIGLLGTLKGMIASFSVIALSDTQLKASAVAGGISEALILTFEGVFLSVPAIYFFAVFKNRVMGLTAASMLEADEFVRRLSNAARGKGGAAPSGAKVTAGA
ncbi:MAG TPA: MotA/TolQ/ExbB proton channel family protein [Pirellulales bacterium]|jgi:biopolymer transport protein ExbB|nr:MotA/TolQ/ExbB proton channel family protein [Pirellulales bacterium]